MSYTFSLVSAALVALMMIVWIRTYAPDAKTRWLGTGNVILLFAFVGYMGASGKLTDFYSFPPPMTKFLIFLLLLSLGIILSPAARRLIDATPLRVLIGLQIFRILPELFLDLAWREGLAPIQMTFHGRNGDILTAISALVLVLIWPRLKRPRFWAGAHTALGLLLLINILTIAILSMPLPFRVFMNEPANTFVTQFPYVYLPGIHVVTALILHGLTVRKLWRERTIQE